jgi:4-hydroxyphenylpyruvate dioxygenase
MIPADAVVLHDTYGLVRSRALATADRAVRFPLNTSEARNTATSRSVSTFAGAGVHHIALATGDIFDCVDKLKAAGAEVLQIPPNYYDDLPARFDLDPDFVDRLQAANVLYDQDDNGAFLNAYTPPFEDRFFVEIVQRVENYEGYGAANAPVRMAALSHWRARSKPAGMPRT